jgi:hypothetical protein
MHSRGAGGWRREDRFCGRTWGWVRRGDRWGIVGWGIVRWGIVGRILWGVLSGVPWGVLWRDPLGGSPGGIPWGYPRGKERGLPHTAQPRLRYSFIWDS